MKSIHLRGIGNSHYQWINFDEWQFNKEGYMNEEWALKAISEGVIQLGNTTYDIVSNTKGSCDGCCFHGSQCPSKAITICCSHGGNILKVAKLNDK